MRMKKYLSIVLLGGCALAGSQISPNGGAYLLRMKFKPGSVYKYAVNMTFRVNSRAQSSSQNTTMKVLSVKNGVGTINISSPGGKGPDGSTIPAANKTLQMNNRGQAVGGDSMGMTQVASFPQQAIKVGGSWTGSYTIQGLKADTKYTLLGMSSKHGRNCAHVSVSLTMGAPVNGRGNGEMFVGTDDGQVVESGMKLKMNPPSQPGQPTPNITVEFTMHRSN